MAEQSQFSKLSKKQLVFICEKLVDEDFPIGNPYETDFDDAFNILQDVSKYFGLTTTNEDVEFFAKLLEINDELIADLFANNKEQMKNRKLFEQLVIPEAYNADILKGRYTDFGHPGKERTLKLIRERFFWPGMSSEVEEYVFKCDRCLRRKTATNTRASLVNVHTNYPS